MYSILRGGCNTRHPSSFKMNRPNGVTNYLFILTKNLSVFTIQGKESVVQPNFAVVISPNTPYSYKSLSGEYIDDWLHFDISDDIFLEEKGIPTNSFFSISDSELFSTYIRILIYENTYTDEKYHYDNINHLMEIFLNHLRIEVVSNNTNTSYSPYCQKLRQIRLALSSSLYDAQDAEYYATKLGISKSHFQHLYTSCFGISFQQDLIRIRIDYAKDLLETTELSLEQVAETTGYNNEIHFYRQFKAATNMTPAHYRKHFRNPDFH